MRAAPAAKGGNASAGEAGEAPPWLLLTLMTAGLVIVLWGIAGPAYELISHARLASPSSSAPQPAKVGFHRHD